ncbi:thiolase family protein [Candidatus Bipolaricaulota bacterium]|nr:thiolase family protein [Candidatus Bipolaricaulota bacterium]
MSKKRPVIVSAVRTPVGSFGGSLKDFKVTELGTAVIKEALKQAGVRPVVSERLKNLRPDKTKDRGLSDVGEDYNDWSDDLQGVVLDEVIMGNVLQGGQGQNTARQASVRAGVPVEVNAYTVNKVCASGMKAISLASQEIRSGTANAVVAGGMENMSRAPYVLPDLRWGGRMFDKKAKDLMVLDGLYEIFYDYHMGVTAENIAELYEISREEQDRLGLESNNRSMEALESGRFMDEIVPIEIEKKGEKVEFTEDECPMDTSLEKMNKLPTVFKEDGTVTAGNASGISDGAAALLITSEEFARKKGLPIKGYINGETSGGVDPKYMGLGPVPATKKLMSNLGRKISDYKLVELNEAFASQTLACIDELELDPEITNPLGSGISLGHPIGCTGARIVVTLLHEMEKRDSNLGLATLCIGGGQGMATEIERK